MNKPIIGILCNFICSILFLLQGLMNHLTISYIGSLLFLFCGIYNIIRYCKKTKK